MSKWRVKYKFDEKCKTTHWFAISPTGAEWTFSASVVGWRKAVRFAHRQASYERMIMEPTG